MNKFIELETLRETYIIYEAGRHIEELKNNKE